MRTQSFQTREFDDLIAGLLESWHIPGLAIAIVDRDETHCKYFGHAQFSDRKFDSNTLFDCASTSKSFTAAAIALLIESHENPSKPALKWSTPVHDVLPDDFVMSDPEYTKNVTIEDILSHRSGLPSHDSSYLGVSARTPDSPRSVTRNLRNLPINRPIRSAYQYCNMMYTVATHLVEEVSQESFATFLQKRLWDPLGMEDTYLDLAGVEAGNATERLARGYFWHAETEEYREVPWARQPEAQGAGSVVSTVKDYAKWLRCMLRCSLPLSADSHKELVTPRIIEEPDDDQKMQDRHFSHTLYALGWEVVTYRGNRVVGHDGCVTGFASTMKYLPGLDWGIVVFANGDNGANEMIEGIAMRLIDEVLGVAEAERADWLLDARQQYDEDEEEAKEEERVAQETWIGGKCEELPLPIDAYVGAYSNAGYHEMNVELKEGKLWADCTDRSFPFFLLFEHMTGGRFWVKLRDARNGEDEGLKSEFQVEEGRVVRMGIAFEPEMPDEMIWFVRTE